MSVKPAFEPDVIVVNTADIITIKTVAAAFRTTDVYRRIAASLENVGLIEPLVVFPTAKGTYLLMDGHTRLDILTATGATTVKCLLSTDNESYTYNKRVNHVPPIARHHMILKALAHVSEERIAKALNVSVSSIREKRDLLKGICPEAAELMRNERVSGEVFTVLRKMKPIRQVDVARLMLNAKKFTGRFARALLDGTRDELLLDPPTKRTRTASPAQQSMLEQETEEMLKHAESIRANYGNDVLDLTSACRYVEQLLGNNRISRYLAKHHQEILTALQQLLADIDAEKQQRRVAAQPVNGAAEVRHSSTTQAVQ